MGMSPAARCYCEITLPACDWLMSVTAEEPTLLRCTLHEHKLSVFPTAGTSLVVDGEAIPYKRVYVEVHPSLCNAIVA